MPGGREIHVSKKVENDNYTQKKANKQLSKKISIKNTSEKYTCVCICVCVCVCVCVTD